MVNPNGNFPEGNSALGLPTNEWVHVAVVWDATTGDRIIYTNGEEVARDQEAAGRVSLLGGSNGCFIGRAYNDERWLEGDISEVRIWNVQRTQEEIASHFMKWILQVRDWWLIGSLMKALEKSLRTIQSMAMTSQLMRT